MAELEEDPVLRPWMVRALRQRPKLLEIETREKFLKQLEQSMSERRTPSQISARLSRLGFDSAAQAMEPAMQEAARDRMEKANKRFLKRL